MSSKKEDTETRDIPRSLKGIEVILRYLYDKEPVSIRNISESTNNSMRVVKNILLQLEQFNQVERATEKNKILPKWKITKFGKKVIEQMKDSITPIETLNKEDRLLKGISISSDLEKLNSKKKNLREKIDNQFKDLQTEVERILGPILSQNKPRFEDLVSLILNRVKYSKQKYSEIPPDPIESYKLKKMGEKKKSVSKEEQKMVLAEINFFNNLISNELEVLAGIQRELSQSIENSVFSNGYSVALDLREELRNLKKLVNSRELIKVNSHVLSKETLKDLLKNKIDPAILEEILDIHLDMVSQIEGTEEVVLAVFGELDKGRKQLNGYDFKITDTIPLYTFYQLVLDENPDLTISINDLESVINRLANKGIIPGIKIVQPDKDHYFKLVQLRAHDISNDENKIIGEALKLQKFTLADIIDASGMSKEQVSEILENLSELGILKYSKSSLHGDRWYIVSDQDPNVK